MTATKNAEATKGFGIVALIMAVLKLDEAGKIGKFFAKEVKKFESAIRDLKNNVTEMENVYQSDTDKINGKLEDAKEAVEDAYQAVTIENVANNATMESFAASYWRNIDSAQALVTRIEKQIADAAEAQVKALKEVNDQIAKYQARIDKINA